MSAASAIQPAIAAGVYRNTGSYGSPTWVEITLVRDVTPSEQWAYGDASVRASKAKLYGKTQIDLTGTITCRADPADAGYQALFDAAVGVSSAAPDLMILDGDITTEGARGVRLHANLSKKQNQAIGEIVYTDFDYNPAWNSAGYPSSVVMGATSTPAFTAW